MTRCNKKLVGSFHAGRWIIVDSEPYFCELEAGHEGPHRNGVRLWGDAWCEQYEIDDCSQAERLRENKI